MEFPVQCVYNTTKCCWHMSGGHTLCPIQFLLHALLGFGKNYFSFSVFKIWNRCMLVEFLFLVFFFLLRVSVWRMTLVNPLLDFEVDLLSTQCLSAATALQLLIKAFVNISSWCWWPVQLMWHWHHGGPQIRLWLPCCISRWCIHSMC